MTLSTFPKHPLWPPRSTRKTSDSKSGCAPKRCDSDLAVGPRLAKCHSFPFPNQCLNHNLSISEFPPTPSNKAASPKLDNLRLPCPAQAHSWTLWTFIFLLFQSLVFKYFVLFARGNGGGMTHSNSRNDPSLPHVEVFYTKDVKFIFLHAECGRAV
jgi:hypothetical protein